MATSSFNRVVRRAFENDKFHKALMKNAENALKKARIQLSKVDLRKLKSLLSKRSVAKDFKHYKRIHSQYKLKKPLGFIPW